MAEVGSSSTSELVNEINGDHVKAHEMLKELHPWADDSLIEDVLAGVNNDVDEASTLLKLMVSPEQNYNDSEVTENEEVKFNYEESFVDKNKSSIDRATDLSELSCLLEELMGNGEFLPSILSSMGLIQNTKNQTVLEKPFASVLQHSVNFPTLDNCSDMAEVGSSSASELVNEINGDHVKAHEMLKELHPWADNSLIEDVLAGVDNDVDEAEQNYNDSEVTENEEVKFNCEESFVDKNKSSIDRATDLSELSCLLEEPMGNNEFVPSILSSMGLIQNTKNKTVLENPFATVLQHSVNFPTLDNCSDMAEVGSSSTSELVNEINGDHVKAHEMLKELHPWADDSLIEDVLAGVNNDVDEASTLLKLMVSPEQNYNDSEVTENEEVKFNYEESFVDKNRSSIDRATDLSELSCLLEELMGNDEFLPSILSSMGLIQNTKNQTVLEKPFASVLQHSVNFPTLDNCSDMAEVGSSSASELVNEINGDHVKAHEMLKELHPWADNSLIEDVLAGVNNDVDKASTLLKLMVSSEQNYNDSEVTENEEVKFNCEESFVDKNKSSIDRATDLSELSCLLEELMGNYKDSMDEHTFSGKILHDDFYTQMFLNSINNIPVESEWEEGDVYLVHRKEAQRMTSSASRHSKAANDAYLRGDHLSAQFYSRKAREERMIAERLNAKAAKDILRIKNSKNDEWTLDLHGLHVAEAVQALQERLQKIESKMPMKHLACSNSVNPTSDVVPSAPPEFVSCSNVEKWGGQMAFSRARPTSLQVITGKGNHSRGEPVLPTAVRSFLVENRYHYNEARPGVIEVQPKFRS